MKSFFKINMLSNTLANLGLNALKVILTTVALTGFASHALAQVEGGSRKPIPIVNFTNEQWIGQYSANALPAETSQECVILAPEIAITILIDLF
jgi:hypothetical protein